MVDKSRVAKLLSSNIPGDWRIGREILVSQFKDMILNLPRFHTSKDWFSVDYEEISRALGEPLARTGWLAFNFKELE